MNTNVLNKFQGILLTVTGILSVIFGFICNGSGNYSSHTSDKYTYGGDAYTGIQNAAAQTANNVSYFQDSFNSIAGRGFMFILLIAGLVLIITGIFMILKAKLANTQPGIASQVYDTPSPPVYGNTAGKQTDNQPAVESLPQDAPVYNETVEEQTEAQPETEL